MTRPSHPHSRLIRTVVALSITAVVGLLAQSVVALPSRASAAEITCNMGGSFSVIAAEQGIFCSGGGAEGSGYSAASPAYSACRYGLDMSQLPDHFLDFMNLPAESQDFDEPSDMVDSAFHGTIRSYHDPATQRGGWIMFRTNNTTHEYTAMIANRVDPAHEQVAMFNCNQSSSGPEVSSYPDIPLWPYFASGSTDVSAPAASASTSNSVSVTTAQSRLPGRPNEYLVRLDLTNTSTTATFADAGFSLTNLSNVELLSGPRDAACSISGQNELCTVPTVLAGATATLVFHVTTTSSDVSQFAVSLVNLGWAKMKISEALGGTYWRMIAFESRHLVTLP